MSPRLRIELAANRGISAATNQALDLAQGDYVCFLDHDDLLHWSALESMGSYRINYGKAKTTIQQSFLSSL